MKHLPLILLIAAAMALSASAEPQSIPLNRPPAPVLKKGEKQLFVDSVMIRSKQGVTRVIHPAKKLEKPVLTAEMPWEVKIKDGIIDKRVNIYGTVLRDEKTGSFRMWYADAGSVLYATSADGIRWERPMLKVAGRPILERLVLHLVGNGIRRIFISTNYLAGIIEDHFGDGSRFGCSISYLRESPDQPLGTGGLQKL